MAKPRLTDAQREQRREHDRQRLHHATQQLLDSDGWRRWVRVRSRNGLARYSIHNQLLIALAMPEASYVCGLRAWLGLGYQVRRGEKAIRIMAPMPIKTRHRNRPERPDGRRRDQTPPAVPGRAGL